MHELHFDLHFTDYPRSVALAGGLPVELARDADVDDLVERLDGLVLSGGADVDPELYGAEPDVNLGTVERERDEWELALFEAARRRDLPILAICRGFQLLNVALGGTLNQHVDIDEGAGHPQWELDGRTRTHDVEVLAGTRTATVLEVGRWAVNSLHHQTVATVGEGLIVTAVASDGVVEGFETADGSILAVQWHPEMLGHPDPTFSWLVGEAAARVAKLRT